MVFILRRTSDLPVNTDLQRRYDYASSGGVDYYDSKHQEWLVDTFGPREIEISIDSWDDFMRLLGKHGELVINSSTIEIYDAYRE